MKSLWSGLAGAIVGGGLTFAILRAIRLPRFDLEPFTVLLLVLAIVPIFFLVVAIHEAGHLAAGAMQGFRPCLFIVGPLKFERLGPRWRVGTNRSVPLFGGLASGIPRGTERLRQRLLVLVAGGPAASLLTGAVALAWLIAIRPPAGPRITLGEADASGYLLLLIFGLMSLAITAASLMPGTTQGYSSDGAQLLRFRRSAPDVEAEVAVIALSTSSIAGQRPRDWDPDLVARGLTLDPSSARGAVARLFAHLHALDRGDIAAARRHLEEALAHQEHVARVGRPVLLLQAAEFAALHEGDAAAARRLLDDAGDGALIGSHTRAFAEAAVRHVEGRDGVEERLAAAEAALRDALDRGGAAMVADRIRELRARRSAAAALPNRQEAASDRPI